VRKSFGVDKAIRKNKAMKMQARVLAGKRAPLKSSEGATCSRDGGKTRTLCGKHNRRTRLNIQENGVFKVGKGENEKKKEKVEPSE